MKFCGGVPKAVIHSCFSLKVLCDGSLSASSHKTKQKIYHWQKRAKCKIEKNKQVQLKMKEISRRDNIIDRENRPATKNRRLKVYEKIIRLSLSISSLPSLSLWYSVCLLLHNDATSNPWRAVSAWRGICRRGLRCQREGEESNINCSTPRNWRR